MAATDAIWKDDLLGRQEEGATVLSFLRARVNERRRRGATASYVLNLDAGWGHGKTFFLRRLAAQLKAEGEVVALVNAWESDFTDDPMVAITSAIDSALQPFLAKERALKKAWDTTISSGGVLLGALAKNVAAKAASKVAGDFLQDAAEVLDIALDGDVGNEQEQGDEGKEDDREDESYEAPDGPPSAMKAVERGVEQGVKSLTDKGLSALLKLFRTQERSIRVFKQQLSKLSHSLGKKDGRNRLIYVLVDELDRCRPSYAIKVLEAAKHLFETNGVAFIVATDTAQLSASVKAVYGAEFESERYLRRFFDRTYRFREPERLMYVESLVRSYAIELSKLAWPAQQVDLNRLMIAYADMFDLSLRDIDQCFDMLATITSIWSNEVPIILPYIWTLIILYHKNDRLRYEELARGVVGTSRWQGTRDVTVWEEHISSYDSPPTRRAVNGVQLLTAVANLVGKPLNELRPEQNTLGYWLFEQMQKEFSTLHQNRSGPSGRGPVSIIGTYRSFVELAARFEPDVAGLRRGDEAAGA